LLLFAVSLLIVGACAGETPEQQVRRLIDRAESAVGDRDLGALADMVSDDYRDPQGYGKREVLGIARFQLQQHPSIHTLKRITALRPTGETTMEVELLVAAAGVEIRDFRSLESVSADLLRFRLVVEREAGGRWRVTSAPWKSAEPADFLALGAP